MLAIIAAAYTRYILRLGKTNPRSALQKVSQLEVWLGAAAFMIAGQMASHQVDRSTADAHNLDRLQAISMALMCLIVFVQRLKRRLLTNVGMLLAWADHTRTARSARSLAHTGPVESAWYIDTS